MDKPLETNTNVAPVTSLRIFQLRIPQQTSSAGRLAGVAIVTLITFIAFGAFFAYFISLIGSLGLNSSLLVVVLGILAIFLAGGATFWVVDQGFDSGSHRTRHKHAAYFEALARGERLNDPGLSRIALGAMARGLRQKSDIQKFCKRFAGGEVVLIHSEALNLSEIPPPHDVPFEPIDLEQDVEQAANLLVVTAERLEPDDSCTDEVQEPTTFALLKQYARAYSGPLAWLALCAWWIGPGVLRGNPKSVALLCVFLAPILTAYIVPLFHERRWFAAPGCLLFREHRFGRRGASVGTVTPRDTPLILDLRNDMAYVRESGRIRAFVCPEPMNWALLVAWQSTARRPEPSEIRALLTGSAES